MPGNWPDVAVDVGNGDLDVEDGELLGRERHPQGEQQTADECSLDHDTDRATKIADRGWKPGSEDLKGP